MPNGTDKPEQNTWVVIRGMTPGHIESDEELRSYIEGIVYGVPAAIYGVRVGRNFVAVCRWPTATQDRQGTSTWERMASFSYASSLMYDGQIAFSEFGAWIGTFSGHSEPLAQLDAGVI